MNSLMWFRNDLRSYDNGALLAASQQARSDNSKVFAVYIDCPLQWQKHAMAKVRHHLVLRRVAALKAELAALNIELLTLVIDDFSDCPALITQLAVVLKVTQVYCSIEWELYEQQRDSTVAQALEAHAIAFNRYVSDVLCPPGSVLTKQGDPFKVFTPYKKAWLTQVQAQLGQLQPYRRQAMAVENLQVPASDWLIAQQTAAQQHWQSELAESAVHWQTLYPVTEHSLLEQLRSFCQEQAIHYQRDRDFPALSGTSKLSAYLAIGAIGPRQCLARLRAEWPELWQRELAGPDTWLSELVWREFYKQVMVCFDHVQKHHNFDRQYDTLQWRNNESDFTAWCQGQTGYPIVDAAMRQLNETGWMHNRLRMIAASFLVKDLQIDWRWGERYFMQQLVDGDLAANNGGWQWAASTGTDAAPYFRIFNPTTQGEKFDPKGEFVRKFVPELKNIPGVSVHQAHEYALKHRVKLNYVKPVIDHAKARLATLAMYGQSRGGTLE